MNKNYHFKALWKMMEERNIIKGENLITIANNESDDLIYHQQLGIFILQIRRENSQRIFITQHITMPAAFGLVLHEYNGKPPYLQIDVGSYCSIMHFVWETEQD
ncbi:MAG: hypothetical protein IJ341_12745 [Bacteroidales bacterium]|nr:hypothetical protein [Bacteroidales bacterium]